MHVALLNIDEKSKLEALVEFAKQEGIELDIFESESVEDYLLGRLIESSKSSKKHSKEEIDLALEDAIQSN
ncbi:MAG: hypothetical protein Kapaf2KO_05740 [Candidatus Kapaibacteriales bacterium]